MSINAAFLCPNPQCVKRLKGELKSYGKSARCHSCGTRFKLSISTSADGTQSLVPIEPELLSDAPVTTHQSSTALPIKLPESIGRFRVLSMLGGGAFGIVYRASDPDLERHVAVKVPKPGTLSTPQRVKRFLGDAKAAARLRHPNIVPVFDVGMHEENWFIASALIEGVTLADAIEEQSLDLRTRMQIVRQLAEALEYAHTQGVVHRDVKPDNVMLDTHRKPHIIDFGLAKMDASGEGTGRAVMGTPAYMSPEQAAGRSHDADAKSDQYSLGVTMFELLTGKVPFSGPPSIVQYHVVNTEPPALETLDSKLPIDLILICNCAMSKDPEARYHSCGEFADDLRRWLDGETPRVRVLTRREQLNRWVRKEPRMAAAIGITSFAVMLVAILGIIFGVSSTRQARNLSVANKIAEDNAENAVKAKELEVMARKEEEARAIEIRRTLALAHFDRAVALCELGEIAQGMNWFVEAIREAEAAGYMELSHTARVNLSAWRNELNVAERAVPLDFHPLAIAVSKTGEFAIVTGEQVGGGGVIARHTWKGQENRWSIRTEKAVRCVAIDPSGQVLLTGDDDGELQARSTRDGQLLGTGLRLTRRVKILSLAIHPSGKAILAGFTDRYAKLFTLSQPLTIGIVTDPDAIAITFEHSPDFQVNSVAFHPDENQKLILTGAGAEPNKPLARTKGGDLGEARIFDSATGKLLASVDHRGVVKSVAFHPRGDRCVTGSGSLLMGEGRVWETATLAPVLGGVFPHIAEVNSVAFTPDGRYVLTAGQDRAVRIWDALTFKQIGQPLRHANDMRAVAATADRVFSVSDENAIREWTVAPGPLRASLHGVVKDSPVIFASHLPGEEVWVSKPFGVERRVSHTGSLIATLPAFPGPMRTIVPSGVQVAVGGGVYGAKTGFAQVLDAYGASTGFNQPTKSEVWSVGLSPNGDRLAAGCDDGKVLVWSTGDSRELWSSQHGDRVYVTTFHPSGNWLLTCARDKTAKLRDASTGTVLQTIDLPDIGLSGMFSADGKQFLVGYAGGCRLFEWDGESKPKPIGELPHQAGILFAAFDQQRTSVITGGSDERVRHWDYVTRKPLGPGWSTGGQVVRGAAFKNDNTVFIAQTDHKRGAFNSYSLSPAASGSSEDLSHWVWRSAGVKLKNGNAEVVGVSDLTGPRVTQPIDDLIANSPREKPAAIVFPPVAVVRIDPKPAEPPVVVSPQPKPKPTKSTETGGADLSIVGGWLQTLVGLPGLPQKLLDK